MKKYFITSAILVILISCKKDKVISNPETIYPLPYLPVYPGSVWNYIDDNGDTIVYKTDDSYRLHSYRSYEAYGNTTNPVYVPYWNGNPIYGYSTPMQTFSPSFPEEYARGLKQIGFLSETKETRWITYQSQYGYALRVVVKTDTAITVNSLNFNHVIVVNDSGGSFSYPMRI